ncbi:MAG: integrase core domain-containing protein [Actinobacteria bacterium]|nr:integrase core domain-containing protein [Actinomycetota bacterium]
MSEKLAFVQACLDRKKRIADICSEFGISEKTGHKQLKRFREEGVKGLEDRSHAGLTHRYRITPEVRERVIALRRRYPLYGAQMLRDWLLQHEPGERWPAASSIGELLKRSNLIRARRRCQGARERAALDTGRTSAFEPNMVWTADFKGEFRLGSGTGVYCYPLTVLDLHSRFLLGCTALETTAVARAKEIFTRFFREYGLPRVLRTDNGVPFAQPNALGRLGRLAFWWVRLGIRPEHTTPARPSENGAHERFHRTLKAATTKPSSASFRAQQRRFDDFRTEYNTQRPHSSLPDHKPPGQFYSSSPRTFPARLPALVYPEPCSVRLVQAGGCIKWRGRDIFLSTNIAGDYVGVAEIEGDRFTISYGELELGQIEAGTNRFSPSVRWSGSS